MLRLPLLHLWFLFLPTEVAPHLSDHSGKVLSPPPARHVREVTAKEDVNRGTQRPCVPDSSLNMEEDGEE